MPKIQIYNSSDESQPKPSSREERFQQKIAEYLDPANLATMNFHYGPGAHPGTGTSQDVHGDGGGGERERVTEATGAKAAASVLREHPGTRDRDELNKLREQATAAYAKEVGKEVEELDESELDEIDFLVEDWLEATYDDAGKPQNIPEGHRAVQRPDGTWGIEKELPDIPTRNIIERATAGGFTYQPFTEEYPDTGYVYSIWSDREKVIPVSDVTSEALEEYVIENADLLTKENHYFGGWVENDNLYLDVSKREDDLQTALKEANETQQLAIFNLDALETVYTEYYYQNYPEETVEEAA